MTYAIRVDCFTTLDELRGNERRDPEAVLAVLRRAGRFSVWDMDDQRLASTVTALKHSGRITTDHTTHAFPWIGVTVEESQGNAALSDQEEKDQ